MAVLERKKRDSASKRVMIFSPCALEVATEEGVSELVAEEVGLTPEEVIVELATSEEDGEEGAPGEEKGGLPPHPARIMGNRIKGSLRFTGIPPYRLIMEEKRSRMKGVDDDG